MLDFSYISNEIHVEFYYLTVSIDVWFDSQSSNYLVAPFIPLYVLQYSEC